MAKLPTSFDFGPTQDIDTRELLRYIQEMYTQLAQAINLKPDLYQRDTDGQTTDTFLSNGSLNINTTTQKVEMLTDHPTQTTVTWTQLS